VPVPVNEDEVGEFDALLVNDALAEAAPVPVGVNVTVNETGVPTVTVTGNVKPVMANSVGFVPLNATDETVTLAPLAVKVPVAVPLVPTTTLPTPIGLVAASVPCAPIPVPVRPMLRFGFWAFDVTLTLPLKLPADGGVNVTLNCTLCSDVSVTGSVIPDTLKPVPLAATAVICALVPPVLVIVSVFEEFCPTVTFVKVRLVGFAVSVAGVTPVPDSGMPMFAEPLTVSDIVPLTAPATVGSKVTLNVVL
jgi:hypothetical protein